MFRLFLLHLRNILGDQAILIFCLLVPLGYPLLYSFIYTGETVREVPVAVIDDCRSADSRAFVRRVDATADVAVMGYCANRTEAEELVRKQQVYGIVVLPKDFSHQLARGEQVAVQVYADMAGMLYYKAILTSCTNVSLDMGAKLKVQRGGGTTREQDAVAAAPIAYEEVSLFNPQTGFAAFLIPAVLMLIIQQTFILGVGIGVGTARERGLFRRYKPLQNSFTGLFGSVAARCLAFLVLYIPVSVYVAGIVPYLFDLPQLVRPSSLAVLLAPYLLGCFGFASCLGVFVRHREYVIPLIVFTSVPLLFLSGISWPGSAVPEVWKWVSSLFPSTFGIQGFVALNNMGASLGDIRPQLVGLSIQALVYFLAAIAAERWLIGQSAKLPRH